MERPPRFHERRCECGASDCTAYVEMSWQEQDAADDAGHWVIAPGHEPLGGRSWHVIRATDRFVVVEIEEEEVR